MTAKYLSLPECPCCSRTVECVIEEDVSMHYNYYTVRCICFNITTSVTKEAVEQGGETYAVDMAWQRWKEGVDKMHMVRGPSNEENPGSKEETGVSDDALWEAVLSSMWDAYVMGSRGDDITKDSVMEEVLLVHLRNAIDNPPDDPY